MHQKNIILVLAIAFFISFSILSFTSRKEHQLGKSWFLYFEKPESDSLNFVVENFSDTHNFHWSLSADNQAIIEGNLDVLKNTKKNVIIEKLPAGEKFLIEVSTEKEKKEIYKTR